MVHVVDMTADEIREAADGHRARGQHDTAASMLRLIPVLPRLTEGHREKLRTMPVPMLRTALSEIVLAYELDEIRRLGT